jgi:hypothetical protein
MSIAISYAIEEDTMRVHVYEVCLPKDIPVGYIEDEAVSAWVGNRYTGSSQERFLVYWENGRVAGYVVPGGNAAEIFVEINGQSVFVGLADDFFPYGSPDNSDLWVYQGNKRSFETMVGKVHKDGQIYQTEATNPSATFGMGKTLWSGQRIGYIKPPIDIRLMAGAAYLLLFNTDSTREWLRYEDVDIDWSKSPVQISGYPQTDTWDFRRALNRLMEDEELRHYFAQGWSIDWVKPWITDEQYSFWKRYAQSAFVKGYTVHLKKRKVPS